MLWMFVALTGCRPSLTFNVTRPAEIAVEQNIQRLAVINRFGSDEATATAAAFNDELLLLSNPRFTAVSRQAANNAMGDINATEGQPLAPTQVTQICEALSVSGIVSLEDMSTSDAWFDSERIEEETTTVTVNGVPREETREVTVYDSTFTLEIATTWRLYSCENGRVRDFYQTVVANSWYGTGASRADARIDVGETDDLTSGLSITAAWVYLKRISPYDEVAVRRYYRGMGGDSRLGSLQIGSSSYEEAAKTLRRGIKEASGKKKGKMLYNLAIALEQAGNLDGALKQAKRANRLLDNSMSNDLVWRLRSRTQQEAEIREQLDAPAPEPEGAMQRPAERADTENEEDTTGTGGAIRRQNQQ